MLSKNFNVDIFFANCIQIKYRKFKGDERNTETVNRNNV